MNSPTLIAADTLLSSLTKDERDRLIAKFVHEESDRLLNTGEVARRLGKSKSTIRRLAAAGTLRPVHINGLSRLAGYSEKEIARLITEVPK